MTVEIRHLSVLYKDTASHDQLYGVGDWLSAASKCPALADLPPSSSCYQALQPGHGGTIRGQEEAFKQHLSDSIIG